MTKKMLLTFLVMCTFSAMIETQAGADTLDATEAESLCKDFPFSSDADPTYGCKVAAALDMSMPGTVNQVATRFKKWGPKQRKFYLTVRLPEQVRRYTFAAYFHDGATRNAMFRKTHANYMENDALATFLQAPATRLDVVRAMRPRSYSRLAKMMKKKGVCQKACPAP